MAWRARLLHDERMRALTAPLIPFCAVLSGCMLLAPLDGLDADAGAGAADAPAGTDGVSLVDVADAAEAGDVAPAADVPVDTSVHDAASDGGVDAVADTVSTPDASAHFCAFLSPAPVLCEDFDEGTAFDARFTAKFVASTAHLGADGAYAKTAPDSLFSSTDTSTPFVNSYAYLSRVFTGTGSRLELAFDVLLVQTVSGQSAVTAALIVDDGLPTQHQLAFVLGSLNEIEESFVAADGGSIFLDTQLAVSPTPGTWSRVDIVLSLPQRTATVTVDGAAAVTAAPLDSSWPASGVLTADVGIGYVSGTSGPWDIRYDDVVGQPQ